jgi:hypothetical protein
MLKQIGVMSVAAALAVGVAVVPAMAGPTTVSGTIALESSTARAANDAGGLRYGESARFTVTASGRVDSKAYLYISVVCFAGDTFVYQATSRDLSYAFPLSDQTGQGLEWNGQAADCEAWLVYRTDKKNGTSDIQELDETTFAVEAAN